MQASLRFPRCSGLRSVAAQRHSSLPARVVTPARAAHRTGRVSSLRIRAEAVAGGGAPSATDGPPPVTERKPPPAKKPAANAHSQAILNELAKSGAERKVVVLQVAPAVRVAISEAYGLEPGAIATGKLVAGLKKLGFDYVFDTLVAADLTIMEEGTELLHRLTDHLEGHSSADEPMPMFSSCCPGWVAMVEKSYPELIPYLSTCKSPQMMFGSVIKNFFATEAGVTASNIVSCSLMPCVRKQGEADRPAVNNSTTADGGCDVDHVITTVDVAGLLADAGIDLRELEPVEFDDPLGVGSGAAQLFGSTGGVMEAALRTVVELVEGRTMEKLEYADVRGLEGIKEATVTVNPCPSSPLHKHIASGAAATEGLKLRVAVANGLGNAKKLITAMKAGETKYDFIEVMACPGGCIGGGGQPRSTDKQIVSKRQQAMYSIDERKTLRRSHENPIIKQLYEKWLGSPNSHVAHEKLHTMYVPGGAE